MMMSKLLQIQKPDYVPHIGEIRKEVDPNSTVYVVVVGTSWPSDPKSREDCTVNYRMWDHDRQMVLNGMKIQRNHPLSSFGRNFVPTFLTAPPEALR
jgi:hypothetical protein